MSDFAFNHIGFGDILSHDTAYGLIWTGEYHGHQVVIKMIMLTSGIHYDKDTGTYFDGQNHQMATFEAELLMSHDDPKPWYHTLFKERRSMTPGAFLDEAHNYIYLSKYGLCPDMLGYGLFDHTANQLHYGFIVMERLDGVVKDILLKRLLSEEENRLVKQAIENLHTKAQVSHGDMKPSNIGVLLHKDGTIRQVKFIDLQKIRHRSQISLQEFENAVRRDNLTFEHHVDKNIELDRKKSKRHSNKVPK